MVCFNRFTDCSCFLLRTTKPSTTACFSCAVIFFPESFVSAWVRGCVYMIWALMSRSRSRAGHRLLRRAPRRNVWHLLSVALDSLPGFCWCTFSDCSVAAQHSATDQLCNEETSHFDQMRGTQVSTGDAWASTVARNLITGIGIDGDYDNEHPVSASMVALVGFFFASYVLVVGVVLMNIVIAVLLDEFISTVEREKQEAKARVAAEHDIHNNLVAAGPLDPLIKGLMAFTTKQDLLQKIITLYQRIDMDESGAVDMQEFNDAMKKMCPGSAVIRLTSDDWSLLTENGALLNLQGELSERGFEKMILAQIASFTRRKVVRFCPLRALCIRAHLSYSCSPFSCSSSLFSFPSCSCSDPLERMQCNAMQRIDDDHEGELMFALKMLMSAVDQVRKRYSLISVLW